MLQLSNVGKRFGTHVLFDDITLEIVPSSRIALIGRNGAGKSTLLKMMLNQVQPDEGTVSRVSGIRVNCLTQEPHLTPGLTLLEEVNTVFAEANHLAHEETQLLAGWADYTEDQQMAALTRLDEIHREMQRLDKGTIEAKIDKMLTSLGFTTEDFNRKVEQFSGGWQMRINLAKVLLEGADVLLLDEPTNHLDLDACEWMENFLKNYEGGIVLVSHDRRFLDEVATSVAEIEFGKLRVWPGNYSAFLDQKANAQAIQTSAATRQQKELAKQIEFVDRFRASATKSTQAKSREKQLAKVERIEAPKQDTTRIAMRFEVKQPSGREVLTIRDLAKGFGATQLFSHLEADLERNERVFLLGENGTGKTTLFRLITGLEKPDAGSITPGHNVQIGYFSQKQLETLDPNKTLFETLHDARPDMTHTEVRTILGRFLFTGEQVFKNVSILSGGEKSRLAIAKLMLSGPNTLLLDEPTNHMDIPAKEVLEEAFANYAGTMICISHDRYFIQQLATQIWEIYNGRLIVYPGDYNFYLRKREELRAKVDAKTKSAKQLVEKPAAEKPKVSEPLAEQKARDKQIKKIEKAIMKLEEELAPLKQEMMSPRFQQDYTGLQILSQQIGDKEMALAKLNAEWETLSA